MEIENFLSDLSKQKEELTEKQKLAAAEKQKQEKEDTQYLSDFNSFYVTNILVELRKIKEKLNEKFDMEYDSETSLQQHNVYFGKIKITPKFDSGIKEVKISIIGEAGRRLITVAGETTNNLDSKKHIAESFQDTFEKFKALNIEDQISRMLASSYLKAK